LFVPDYESNPGTPSSQVRFIPFSEKPITLEGLDPIQLKSGGELWQNKWEHFQTIKPIQSLLQ